VRDGGVVVRRVGAEYKDPAIGAFLSLIEADIRAGRRVQSLPNDLARAMVENAHRQVNLDEEIEEDVERLDAGVSNENQKATREIVANDSRSRDDAFPT
jgi:hypothetical protein